MRVFVSLLALSLLGFALFAGCSFEIPEGRFACDVDSDCPSQFRCVAQRCTRGDAGVDAGVDAGDADASVPDAGVDAATPQQDCAMPGDGTIVLSLSMLDLPEMGEVVGFDLDEHSCGAHSNPGGVDNELAEMLLLSSDLSETDYHAWFQGSVTSGHNEVHLELEGYDGPNDAATLVSVFVGGEPLAGAQSICTTADAEGAVEIALPLLPYSVPNPEDEDAPFLPLDLHGARIRIDNPLASSPVSGVIGGSSLFDDGEGGAIRGYLVEAYDGLDITVDELIAIWEFMLDMGPPGECDSISLGLKAEFTVVEGDGALPGSRPAKDIR